LPRDFAAIVRAFGLELPPDVMADAAVLAFTIECVDRRLDSIPDPMARQRFALVVEERLASLRDDAVELPAEAREWLDRLADVLARRKIRDEFLPLVRDIFANCEAMRTARSGADYARCAGAEGRLMVEMLLAVLGPHATPEFAGFMRRLAVPAELVDKFRDARRDFDAGEMAIAPGMVLRLRLIWSIARDLPALAARCIARRGLASWGARSLWLELRSGPGAVTR